MEAELSRLCCREQIIIEGQTFHSKQLLAAPEVDNAIVGRWLILRAWRWLIRDNEMEKRYSDAYDKNNAQAKDMEDDFDMAYRVVIPAPLGRSIMKVNEKDDRYSDEEEYATTLESDEAAREICKRSSNWKKRHPVMAVIITLPLGLRKLRAEFRRRVEAWKHLSSLA